MAGENLQASASECLKNYTNHLSQLFYIYNLILQNKRHDDPIEIIKLLLEEDQKLQLILQKVQEHQLIYSRIQRLKTEISTLEENKLKVVKTLWDAQLGLKDLVINSIEQKKVSSTELLDYAQRVAKHTLAPFAPPIPQENLMRMSLLFKKEEEKVIVVEDIKESVDVMEIDMEMEVSNEVVDEDLDLDLF